MTDPQLPVPTEEPTIGRLVKEITEDAQALVQGLISLVKSELKVSISTSGVGIGLFAGAAFFGVMALIMLSVALAYFLAWTGLDLAWCFLIVFGLYLLITAILGLIGLRKVKSVHGPERTLHQVEETKAILKK